MSTNDPPRPGGESRSRPENEPPESTPDDPGSRGESGRRPGGSQEPREPTKVDFGSFVSSTVRSSADLFKTPGPSSGRRSQRDAAGEGVPARSSSEGGEGDAPAPSRRTQSERPRRYWRDSVAGAASTRETSEPGGSGSSTGDDRFFRRGRRPTGDGGEDGGGKGFLTGLWPDGGGSSRVLLGILAGAVLIIVLIVFFMNRGDDDGTGDRTPEPTTETVIGTSIPSTGSDGTEVSTTATPGRDAEPTEEPRQPTKEPTEERQRGGDNQRDQDEGTQTPEGNRDPANKEIARKDALANARPGPVAKSCPASCVLRVAGSPDLEDILTTAETRPSFAAEKWSWVVASRQGTAYIEANADTILVSPQVNTLNAYVVRIPEGQTDDSAVKAFGTIVDSVDRYRIVEVAKVPARVSPLTESGFEVFKMAPALPAKLPGADEQTLLANIDIGELLDDVDAENLETIIRELQATSSTDGSGVGTRYYALPGNAIASEYLFQRMEALGMKVWYEDFMSPEGLLLVNVVGELPGADPGAIYGVMAHFDTISTDNGNAPGADDNATGIAASLEIARILSGYELNHPVRLIFVNAEEVGIIGSEVWARKIVSDAVPIKGVFNLDSVGSDRQGSLIYLNSDAKSAWMQELMFDINSAYGLGQSLAPRQTSNIVADDNKVRGQGLEAVLVARELYGFSPVHHSPRDLIENVSIENNVTATQLILLSVAELVQ